MNEFFRTHMGMQFFQGTLPRLVAELARLNENLEKDREQRERIHRERSGTLPSEPDCGCGWCGRLAGSPVTSNECPRCSSVA